MAVGAYNAIDGVWWTPDVGAWECLAMALEASVQHLLLGNTRESNDRSPVPSRNMLPSRPVTALTAGAFLQFLLRDDAFVVWIPVEGIRDFGVAVLAHHAADVLIIAGSFGQVRGCGRLRTSDS
jgi:hypothetical protein